MTMTRLSIQRGVPEILVYCFAHLDPRLKQMFDDLVSRRILDKVLWGMVEEKLFPQWFADSVSFDPLYGQLNGLRVAIPVAVRDGLIRMDGTRFNYHLVEFKSGDLTDLLRGIGMSEIRGRRIALELNRRLLARIFASGAG